MVFITPKAPTLAGTGLSLERRAYRPVIRCQRAPLRSDALCRGRTVAPFICYTTVLTYSREWSNQDSTLNQDSDISQEDVNSILTIFPTVMTSQAGALREQESTACTILVELASEQDTWENVDGIPLTRIVVYTAKQRVSMTDRLLVQLVGRNA